MLDNIESDIKIRVEMICECGNTVEEENSGAYDGSSRAKKGAIVVCNRFTYICAKCGKTMSRRVVKTTATETETIL